MKQSENEIVKVIEFEEFGITFTGDRRTELVTITTTNPELGTQSGKITTAYGKTLLLSFLIDVAYQANSHEIINDMECVCVNYGLHMISALNAVEGFINAGRRKTELNKSILKLISNSTKGTATVSSGEDTIDVTWKRSSDEEKESEDNGHLKANVLTNHGLEEILIGKQRGVINKEDEQA